MLRVKLKHCRLNAEHNFECKEESLSESIRECVIKNNLYVLSPKCTIEHYNTKNNKLKHKIMIKFRDKLEISISIYHESKFTVPFLEIKLFTASVIDLRSYSVKLNLSTFINQLHFVFIDGVMNEITRPFHIYFHDNIKAVKEIGFTSSHLHFSSFHSISSNSNIMKTKLDMIIQTIGSRQMFLIGHSMGGSELLCTLLTYPELFERVYAAVMLQSVLGGSSMANQENGNIFGKLLSLIMNKGMSSLTPKSCFELFNSFNYHDLQNHTSKIFYLRSQVNREEKISFGEKIVRTVLDSDSTFDDEKTSSDGLVPVENQILISSPPIGIDLGIMEADHIELEVSGLFSKGNKKTRKLFTEKLIEYIISSKAKNI
jgi:hypothetical protein